MTPSASKAFYRAFSRTGIQAYADAILYIKPCGISEVDELVRGYLTVYAFTGD